MRGAVDEAERIIVETMEIPVPLINQVRDSYSVLIFTLRREQGRLGEVAPFVNA